MGICGLARKDSLLYMLYEGEPVNGRPAIGLATSSDRMHWSKYNGNPVITSGASGSWDDYWIVGGTLSYLNGSFHYWYSAQQAGMADWQIGYAMSEFAPLAVASTSDGIPSQHSLEQSLPNPFNPEATIRFTLPNTEHVTLAVFDNLGQRVATLLDETKPAGQHAVSWRPTNLASGVYYYRLQAGTWTEGKKMMLIK